MRLQINEKTDTKCAKWETDNRVSRLIVLKLSKKPHLRILTYFLSEKFKNSWKFLYILVKPSDLLSIWRFFLLIIFNLTKESVKVCLQSSYTELTVNLKFRISTALILRFSRFSWFSRFFQYFERLRDFSNLRNAVSAVTSPFGPWQQNSEFLTLRRFSS